MAEENTKTEEVKPSVTAAAIQEPPKRKKRSTWSAEEETILLKALFNYGRRMAPVLAGEPGLEDKSCKMVYNKLNAILNQCLVSVGNRRRKKAKTTRANASNDEMAVDASL